MFSALWPLVQQTWKGRGAVVVVHDEDPMLARVWRGERSCGVAKAQAQQYMYRCPFDREVGSWSDKAGNKAKEC